jgi:DNA primase
MGTQKDWVDFRLVKQAVSMQALPDRYGISWLRKNRDELWDRCPVHKGEGERSFHINIVKNAFQCFSCTARGNVLDFVAAME